MFNLSRGGIPIFNSGEKKVVTMIANRWHKDVRTLFFEKDKLVREKDSGDFIDGYLEINRYQFEKIIKVDFIFDRKFRLAYLLLVLNITM